MPSDYAKWLQRDVQPEKPITLTKKERIRNWIDYHWKPALGILLVIIFVVYLLGNVFEASPDYELAVITENGISEEAEAALAAAVAAAGEDLNGDGEVLVQVNQYTGAPGSFESDTGDSSEQLVTVDMSASTTVQMIADTQSATSCLFLVEDAEAFQEYTGLLTDAAGNQAAEGDTSVEGRAYQLSDLNVFAALSENAELAGLYIGRRCYSTESDASEACASLWSAILAGGFTDTAEVGAE